MRHIGALLIGRQVSLGAVPLIGLAMIYFLYMSLKDFFSVLIFEMPIFSLTNPVVLGLFALIVMIFSERLSSLIFAVILFLLLPLLAATSATMMSYLLSFFIEPFAFLKYDFSTFHSLFYGYYFGENADLFKYFKIAQVVSSRPYYEALMIVASVIVFFVVGVMTFMTNYFSIGVLADFSSKRDYGDWASIIEFPATVIVYLCSFIFLIPILELWSKISLPFDAHVILNIFIMALPLLGLNLAFSNMLRPWKEKIHPWITGLYCLFVFYTLYLTYTSSIYGRSIYGRYYRDPDNEVFNPFNIYFLMPLIVFGVIMALSLILNVNDDVAKEAETESEA